MKKILLGTILSFSICSIVMTEDKTSIMHIEAASNDNPNLTQETHPLLYNMIKSLADEAHITMPRYITVYPAVGSKIGNNGRVIRSANEITAWIDLIGDMYICHDALTNLSYEEVEGMVSLAIAESLNNKPLKLFLIGASTFVATCVAVYALNRYYELNLGWVFNIDDKYSGFNYKSYKYTKHKNEVLEGALTLMLVPSAISVAVAANNFQKAIDNHAAQLTSSDQVIKAIKSIRNLEERYFKESLGSRIVSALKLKELFNIIFYPVRPYTSEERIEYLSK